jgi:hypothetical protein
MTTITQPKLTKQIYGQLPKNLGVHNFPTDEMMFWLYCPIKMPGMFQPVYPDQLTQYSELIQKVFQDLSFARWSQSYIYLTAKTLYVTPTSAGNRLGWHSDGFLTEDLNYVWSNMNPTLFFDAGTMQSGIGGSPLYQVSRDHKRALDEFTHIASRPVADEKIVTYPDRSLLRLDETVIHAVNPEPLAGLRTFLKVSVSYEPYALKGNSINHRLAQHPRPFEARMIERNHPQGNKEAA